jgi:hypothetical protein
MQTVSVKDIAEHTAKAKALTTGRLRDITGVTNTLRILALNALIEAKRAGDMGAGFAVVADEVRQISGRVEDITKRMADELAAEIGALETLTESMAAQNQGARLIDLALNAIELIDRNLYERTCDVRWWATDAAMVAAAPKPRSVWASFSTPTPSISTCGSATWTAMSSPMAVQIVTISKAPMSLVRLGSSAPET